MKQRKQPTPADLDHAIKAFPLGCRVTVRRDNGELLDTVTRSEPWIMGGHSLVVMVEGIAGGYLLERVGPVSEEGR